MGKLSELPEEGPAVCDLKNYSQPLGEKTSRKGQITRKNNMSLKIRLSRGGAKKRPFYRVVVADSRSPRDGRFIERLGTFDPLAPKDSEIRLVLDVEKAKAWLAKGAQPTDRVARLLDGVGAIKREAAQQSREGAAEEEGAGTRRRGRRRRRKGRRRRGIISDAIRREFEASPSFARRRLFAFEARLPKAMMVENVLVGVFGAPHGVRGEMRLKSYTQDPLDHRRSRTLHDAAGRAYEIASARLLKDDLLVVQSQGRGRPRRRAETDQ